MSFSMSFPVISMRRLRIAWTRENGERLSSGYILILTTRVSDISETNSSLVIRGNEYALPAAGGHDIAVLLLKILVETPGHLRLPIALRLSEQP